MNPEKITDTLDIEPDRSQKVGDVARNKKPIPVSGWFVGTQGILNSRDIRVHLEWILDRLKDKRNQLNLLVELGFEMKISCFWESASGNGGPILDHEIIARLSEFPLDLHFDVWFDISEG